MAETIGEYRIPDEEVVASPWPDFRGLLLGQVRFSTIRGRYHDPETMETVFLFVSEGRG